MSFIAGVDRHQCLLLPESLEDYVSKNAPVRFIDAFVGGLDMQKCGFARSKAAATGRPPYAPADLLRLYLWGYLNQVASSRKLERECQRNLEVMWLLGKLAPDFKTIADFRKDNAKAFKGVFRAFNLLCRELDLFGAELVAIDGTKLKAVNAIERHHSRKELEELLARIDKRLEEFLTKLKEADSAEEGSAGASLSAGELQKKIEQLRERREERQEQLRSLEESGAGELSETDPDSRGMRRVGVGYNGQIAVDSKHHLIAAEDVVQDANDFDQLAPMAQQAKEALGVGDGQLKAVADMGYYDHEQIARCEQIGVEAYVSRPEKGSAEANGRLGKKDFEYDAVGDSYRCPQGAVLAAAVEFEKRGQPHVRYENPAACRGCPIKAQCTKGTHRSVTRWKYEAVADRMHERVRANPQIIRQRKGLVEHVFGTTMFWMNRRPLLTRGLEKVRAEFTLTALAYNLTRLLNLVSVQELLANLMAKARATGAEKVSAVSQRPQEPSWQFFG
jgi:transposase